MNLNDIKRLAGITEQDCGGVDAQYKTVEQLQGVTEVNRMRKLAGLQPLNEWADDDDEGLSRAERELASSADRELKKKGIKVDADPDKDIEMIAKSKAAKKAAAKEDEDEKAETEAEKSARMAAKAKDAAEAKEREAAVKDDKNDAPAKKEPAGEVKKDQPASQDKPAAKRGDGRGQLRTWIQSNPSSSLSQVKAKAESFGVSKANAQNLFYAMKKAKESAKPVSEVFMFVHPSTPSFHLVENRELGIYQWVNSDSDLEPMMFNDKAEAENVAKHLGDWKNQFVSIKSVLVK